MPRLTHSLYIIHNEIIFNKHLFPEPFLKIDINQIADNIFYVVRFVLNWYDLLCPFPTTRGLKCVSERQC